MVQPIRREGAGQRSVYETINEYQEGRKNTIASRQQQDYQWKLQQLELAESERDALEESTYQVMSSAPSIGDISDSASIAGSHFSYPHQYPSSIPQSPNDLPSPMTQYQQLEAAPNNDNCNTHNSGYQLRPYPYRSTAAAGSSLSPIHEAPYNNKSRVYANIHRLRGTCESNMKPDLSAEEGDEDYTIMNQAGTLTSQTRGIGHLINTEQYNCSQV